MGYTEITTLRAKGVIGIHILIVTFKKEDKHEAQSIQGNHKRNKDRKAD
jgi:hypothetical protein